ncbi:MAG: glycosyltransferase family 4 protein [Syntrophaceae bacterium]
MGKKKKIAVVIPKLGLVGGAENFASELTTRIAADPRYEVHVFANRWGEWAPGITFHHVPIVRFPRSLTTPSFAWFANRAIRRDRFDLVHTHDRIFEADLFTMHGIPHRLWVRDVRKKRMSLFDRSTRWVEGKLVANPRCRRFLAVSTITKEKFIGEFGVEDGRVLVLPPGTDVGRFARRNREGCRAELRRSLGLDPATQILLFVSMNFEVKGLDYVMRGLAHLKSATGQPVPLLFIVGRGNEVQYRRLAEELEIGPNVRFSGVTGRENLDAFYLGSDFFAMLSRFDTFGMAALDAMAASLPVVLSGNVGAKDLVREGVNGFVVGDPADEAAVAGRFARLLDAGLRQRMGQEAFRTACGHSWDEVARRQIEIYEELLGSVPDHGHAH